MSQPALAVGTRVPPLGAGDSRGRGWQGCLPHFSVVGGEGRQGKSMGRGGPDHGEEQDQHCRLWWRSRAAWQLTAPPTLHPYQHRCPLTAQQSRTPPCTQHPRSLHLTASSAQKKSEMGQEPTNTAMTEPQVPSGWGAPIPLHQLPAALRTLLQEQPLTTFAVSET